VADFERVVPHLHPLPPVRSAAPLRVGVNRLLCYATCPRQYWFRNVLQTPALATEEDRIPTEDDAEQRTDDTAFGSLVHSVLQQLDFTQPLLDQLRSTHAAAANMLEMAVTDDDAFRLHDCLRILESLPLADALRRADPLYRELRFLALEANLYLPGIIDALARVDDSWWLVDYKTGYPSATHLQQLALYALGVQHALGVTPERLVIVYFDRSVSRPYRAERSTPALLDEARLLVRRVGEGLRVGRFTPTPGHACSYCTYIDACPEGRAASELTLVPG
jgi:ATP-dependent exoDNAse (exonuclease V) beta subunit